MSGKISKSEKWGVKGDHNFFCNKIVEILFQLTPTYA
jgi:hypothetical protein